MSNAPLAEFLLGIAAIVGVTACFEQYNNSHAEKGVQQVSQKALESAPKNPWRVSSMYKNMELANGYDVQIIETKDKIEMRIGKDTIADFNLDALEQRVVAFGNREKGFTNGAMFFQKPGEDLSILDDKLDSIYKEARKFHSVRF